MMNRSYWYASQAAEVRAWRDKAGLTQEQAARSLKVTLRTWQRWEHGTTGLPYRVQIRLGIGPFGRPVWRGR